MRKKVEVVCARCSKSYWKDDSERKRNEKLGRSNYCSYSCSNKLSGQNFTRYFANGGIRYTGNKGRAKGSVFTNALSPFRSCLRKVRRRIVVDGSEYETDLTLEYLKEVFDKQNGICPYTGYKLTYVGYVGKNDIATGMSLDRIDSSIGYVKGNVQYVSVAANYMKNTMTHEEMIELCKQIGEYWSRVYSDSACLV